MEKGELCSGFFIFIESIMFLGMYFCFFEFIGFFGMFFSSCFYLFEKF